MVYDNMEASGTGCCLSSVPDLPVRRRLQINLPLRGISDAKPMMIIAFISHFIISLPVGYPCGFIFGRD